jgi:hypothetical protein
VSGNWGRIPTGRSAGSRRRRIALAIASVVAGLILFSLLGQLGAGASREIKPEVLLIVGLLIIGVVYGLRPWSDS